MIIYIYFIIMNCYPKAFYIYSLNSGTQPLLIYIDLYNLEINILGISFKESALY